MLHPKLIVVTDDRFFPKSVLSILRSCCNSIEKSIKVLVSLVSGAEVFHYCLALSSLINIFLNSVGFLADSLSGEESS